MGVEAVEVTTIGNISLTDENEIKGYLPRVLTLLILELRGIGCVRA